MGIRQCQNLQTLIIDASYCGLYVSSFRYLMSLAEQCQVLKFNLSHNAFFNEEPELIDKLICEDLQKLELDLSDIYIDAECFKSICNAFAKYSNLKSFDLQLKNSNIDDSCLQHFNVFFSYCTKLDFIALDLSQNRIGEKGAQDFGLALAKCINVTKIKIQFDFNEITDLGVKSIGLAIKDISNLKYLELNFENIRLTLNGECNFLFFSKEK
ncbi:hypothetical protein ABPG72_007250 [Tetrahymena utriculariae]